MPGHRIDFHKEKGRVRVLVDDVIIAETDKAIILKETGIPPVCYVPPEDVSQEYLQKTTLTTHCPFKGDASYWSIKVGDRDIENAIWAYEDPIAEAMPIKGCMAFYTDRVDQYDATHSA